MSKLVLNAISDNVFDCCLKVDSRIPSAVAQAFNRMFQFDCVGTVVYLILVIFPILFKIYGFGVQQRLRRFYDSSRLIFIDFLFLCSFSVVLCAIMHLSIQQPMPCIEWDGRHVDPYKYCSRTPDHELIIVLILSYGVWSLKIGNPIIRFIICVAIVATETVSEVLAGYESLSQAMISLAIGFWVMFVFNFLPPVAIPIIGGSILIVVLSLFGTTFSVYKWKTKLIYSSLHLSIRGSISLLISCVLHLRFGCAREEFDWFKVSWGLGWSTDNESSSGDVVIPSMIKENTKDDFGKVLKADLIDSIIAFVLFLIGNTVLNYSTHDINFMLI